MESGHATVVSRHTPSTTNRSEKKAARRDKEPDEKKEKRWLMQRRNEYGAFLRLAHASYVEIPVKYVFKNTGMCECPPANAEFDDLFAPGHIYKLLGDGEPQGYNDLTIDRVSYYNSREVWQAASEDQAHNESTRANTIKTNKIGNVEMSDRLEYVRFSNDNVYGGHSMSFSKL